MTHFEAYLLTRLDAVHQMMCGALTILFLGIIFCPLFYDMCDIKLPFKKMFKAYAIISISLSLLISIIPSSKEAAFIYIAPAIVNNQDLQEAVKKLPKISNLGLEYFNNLLEKEIKK